MNQKKKKERKKSSRSSHFSGSAVAISTCSTFFPIPPPPSPLKNPPRCVFEPSEIVKLLFPFPLCQHKEAGWFRSTVEEKQISSDTTPPAPPGTEDNFCVSPRKKEACNCATPARIFLLKAPRYTLDKYWRCLYPGRNTAKHHRYARPTNRRFSKPTNFSLTLRGIAA